ncbi:MAG: hypothetical protein ABI325_10510 [Ginsengibacter sp.]
MNTTLKKLKDIISDCCVTITLQTHRTLPDNEKDPILLKNLIKEAHARLQESCGKSLVKVVMDKLNTLAENIDHRHNLESLILFANEDIADYTRLPIVVENRVVIDKTFATRDLIRALHQESSYYILVLSRDRARLIEALNDKVTKEIEKGFPVNSDLNPAQRSEAAIGNRQTNLLMEFFNRVDKQLNEVQKEKSLPVIVCTEESNYPEYLKIADRKEIITGKLNGNRMQDKAHHIVDLAWPVIKQLNKEKNNQRLAELHIAVNSQNFLTDFNEIWQAVNGGRGKTLFVKKGYFQPARLENNSIELITEENSVNSNVDDIIDEMIEKNLDLGGDAVFINGEELDKFQGLVLVTRY